MPITVITELTRLRKRMSYTHSTAIDFFDEDYTKVDWNTYTLPELLLETTAHMHSVIEAIMTLLNNMLSISTRRYRSWSVERHHLVSLLYQWRCIETFKKFCTCEPGTLIDLALLAAMASQDFRGGYPAVADHEDGDDEIAFKMSRNQKKARWSYGRDLEECQVIGKEQNERVWALCERVAKAFEVPFVRPTEAGLKLGVVEDRRDRRLSKAVRQSRDTINWDGHHGEGAHLIPRLEAGWKNPRHSPFWLLVSVICGPHNSAKCYQVALGSSRNRSLCHHLFMHSGMLGSAVYCMRTLQSHCLMWLFLMSSSSMEADYTRQMVRLSFRTLVKLSQTTNLTVPPGTGKFK